MLHIQQPGSGELWDEDKEEFISMPGIDVHMEHSLLAIREWEARHKVPFLNNKNLTQDDMYDYYRCMIIEEDVDPNLVYSFNTDTIKMLNDYVNDEHTATKVDQKALQRRQAKNKKGGRRKGNIGATTAEVIYYWMVSLRIPIYPCESWNIHNLLALIDVHSAEGSTEKMSKEDLAQYNTDLNAARRKALNSRG